MSLRERLEGGSVELIGAHGCQRQGVTAASVRGTGAAFEMRALAEERPGAVLSETLAVVLDAYHAVEDQEDVRTPSP